MSPRNTKSNADRCDAMVRELAAALNVTELGARLHSAAGVPGTPALYDEPLPTLAAVGRAFGVSERSVQTWLASGAPGESGAYSASQIGFWRRSRPDGGVRAGGRPLPVRNATGELFRGACRYFNGEIKRRSMAAADEFAEFCRAKTSLDAKQIQLITAAFECAIVKHMEPVLMDEPTIEAALVECWRLV